jgi:hypothetical protein
MNVGATVLLLLALLPPEDKPPHFTIPVVDLAADAKRRVVIDKEPGIYLGHPTTVLLEDQKTILCVYPRGHGRGPILYKRSTDGGKTWSDRLTVPDNWASSLETPTIHRVVDKKGVKRLILFSGLYPIRMSVSEDDGKSWTPLEKIGDYGGIVAMGCLFRVKNGDYIAMFHDDGRFFTKNGKRGAFFVYQVRSTDGGLTWSAPKIIAQHKTGHLCEPGYVRSPDGQQIAVLLRENSRKHNSFVIYSTDEAQSWSTPSELPAALTGDRHIARYAPDGRLVITFRDMARKTETRGDFCAWVGTYEDIVKGREGQYRVRLLDNRSRRASDTGYAGLELLPDGTFVSTTYCVLEDGAQPLVVCVRYKIDEIDAKAKAQARFGTGKIRGMVRVEGNPPKRHDLTGVLKSRPHCLTERGKNNPLLTESIIVNENGTLRDVVIYLKSGLTSRYPPPKKPALLDQKGCQFVPHVFVAHPQQTVTIKNSDPFLSVVSAPRLTFNRSFPTMGSIDVQRFLRKPGPHTFADPVHSWKSAYGFAIAHPFYALTTKDGKFEIERIPAGTYTVAAWHERDLQLRQCKPQEVVIEDGKTVEIDFVFTIRDKKARR